MKGTLISTKINPIEIKYGEDEMTISPRANIKNVEKEKLPEPLPQGLFFIENK